MRNTDGTCRAVAPIDTSCLRSTIQGDDPRHRALSVRRGRPEDASVSVFSTPAMFHNNWQVVVQVARRDSSVYRGTVYRDSSAQLATTDIQINRRFEEADVALTGAQLSGALLDLRDRCGGRSPGGERLFVVDINHWPYQNWAVRGTDSRVAMRLTTESRRYTLHWPRDAGRQVLRADTVASFSPTRQPMWIEVDSLELPPTPKRIDAAKAREAFRRAHMVPSVWPGTPM